MILKTDGKTFGQSVTAVLRAIREAEKRVAGGRQPLAERGQPVAEGKQPAAGGKRPGLPGARNGR